MNPVFILGLFETGVLTAKCLSSYKIKIYGFDYNKNNIGFKSRLLKSYEIPDPNKNEDLFINFLVDKAELCKEKPILIPASDEFVFYLNKNRELLENYLLFLLP